jgi:tetratricopeptide (TPR) repeat protein
MPPGTVPEITKGEIETKLKKIISSLPTDDHEFDQDQFIDSLIEFGAFLQECTSNAKHDELVGYLNPLFKELGPKLVDTYTTKPAQYPHNRLGTDIEMFIQSQTRKNEQQKMDIQHKLGALMLGADILILCLKNSPKIVTKVEVNGKTRDKWHGEVVVSEIESAFSKAHYKMPVAFDEDSQRTKLHYELLSLSLSGIKEYLKHVDNSKQMSEAITQLKNCFKEWGTHKEKIDKLKSVFQKNMDTLKTENIKDPELRDMLIRFDKSLNVMSREEAIKHHENTYDVYNEYWCALNDYSKKIKGMIEAFNNESEEYTILNKLKDNISDLQKQLSLKGGDLEHGIKQLKKHYNTIKDNFYENYTDLKTSFESIYGSEATKNEPFESIDIALESISKPASLFKEYEKKIENIKSACNAEIKSFRELKGQIRGPRRVKKIDNVIKKLGELRDSLKPHPDSLKDFKDKLQGLEKDIKQAYQCPSYKKLIYGLGTILTLGVLHTVNKGKYIETNAKQNYHKLNLTLTN